MTEPTIDNITTSEVLDGWRELGLELTDPSTFLDHFGVKTPATPTENINKLESSFTIGRILIGAATAYGLYYLYKHYMK